MPSLQRNGALAGELVEFCRHAEGAEDVLFAWSI